MTFYDSADEAASIELPSHVPSSNLTGLNQSTIDLLRQHFLRCMDVHLVGGDISADYQLGEVEDVMYDLGLTGEEELADLDDERWQTPIGKELFRSYMEDRF